MGRFKPFAACVFPAVFAFALSGIYAIVDGFFVGRSIGDTGLRPSILHIRSLP